MIETLRRPLSFVHDITTKHMIKQFVDKFEFVYFGRVDHREDEHQLVRGLTASAEHSDNHYVVGTFRGHDVTLVERQNILHYPGKAPQAYRWLIMQVDLKRGGFPHIFMDAHHHEEVFYANLFVKFGNFEDASRIFGRHDTLFRKHYKVFAPPDMFEEVDETVNPEISAMLAHHFRQFDYEIDDDRLLIYASNTQLSMKLLHEMLRVGVWFADQLNAIKPVEPLKEE